MVDLGGGIFCGGTGTTVPAGRCSGCLGAAGEDACHRDPGGADGPVSGHPVDDDGGGCRTGRGAGKGERAEHAAFHAADPAGQWDEPSGHLPGGVGEQHAPPGDRQPG